MMDPYCCNNNINKKYEIDSYGDYLNDGASFYGTTSVMFTTSNVKCSSNQESDNIEISSMANHHHHQYNPHQHLQYHHHHQQQQQQQQQFYESEQIPVEDNNLVWTSMHDWHANCYYHHHHNVQLHQDTFAAGDTLATINNNGGGQQEEHSTINLYDSYASNRPMEQTDYQFFGSNHHHHHHNQNSENQFGDDIQPIENESYYSIEPYHSNQVTATTTGIPYVNNTSQVVYASNENEFNCQIPNVESYDCVSNDTNSIMSLSMPTSSHFNRNNSFESNLDRDVSTVCCDGSLMPIRYDFDRFNAHVYKATNQLFNSSENTINSNNLGSNSIHHSSMSVNVEMNMETLPHMRQMVNRKGSNSVTATYDVPTIMHTRSAKYKLMAKLSEHITIKKHNYTDVYQIKHNASFCKTKTLFSSETKHIQINHRLTPTSSVRKEKKISNRKNSDICSQMVNKYNLCYICGKNYARPSTLKTHLRTHSGEKPFRCQVCNKAFSQAANLTAHNRIHTKEKPFPCPVCQRRFSQSSSVTTHLRTHTKERPYRCHHCSKSFSDSSTLTKHLRIHSGEKPYRCRMCLLSFSQSGNLNRHMRIHM